MASAATLIYSPSQAGLSPSPSPSQSPSGLDNLSFDDLVEWNASSNPNSDPNPNSNSISNSNSPRMSNASVNLNSNLNSSHQGFLPSTSAQPRSCPLNDGDASHGAAAAAPLYASPETLFRHYLSLELRKMGSPFDDSLLDHYVKQHAQGLARANGRTNHHQDQDQSPHATTSSSFSRDNSPPELDQTASASTSSASTNAASPTFSRRALSLSPLPEEQDLDFHLDFNSPNSTAKAFKISQDQDGQFSHFGRSSLGMGSGMTLENSGFDHLNQIQTNHGQDSEMSSVDPSSLMIKAEDQDLMSEVEAGKDHQGDETLVDPNMDFAALIAKNLSKETESSGSNVPDTQSSSIDQSSSKPTSASIPSVEKPASPFSLFQPPRVGEPPLAPNYSHPSSSSSSHRPSFKQSKNLDEEDETMHSTNAVSNDDPSRPTPEEYKKMSSKEKRQIRNKISARNFRERRKGYIAQLEYELQERDYTIANLRAQLERVGLQNNDLKKEVKTLRSSSVAPTPEAVSTKPAQPPASSTGASIGASISQADVQRILDALQKSTVATQTQPEVSPTNNETTVSPSRSAIPALSSSSSRPSTPNGNGGSNAIRSISPRPLNRSSSSSSLSSTSSPIPVANTRKDAYLSSDGSNSTSSFWAGGRSNSLLGSSGFMSVHTTLLPWISFNPTVQQTNQTGKGINGGRNFAGLTFKGWNKDLRTNRKAEKNQEASSPPPPAYSDHSFSDIDKPEEILKKDHTSNAEEDFDVYDAFASLLRGGSSSTYLERIGAEEEDQEERLPSYVESILAPFTAGGPPTANLNLSEGQGTVEECLLEALFKAFSSTSNGNRLASSNPSDSKTPSTSNNDGVDMNKLQSLLDGKAELVLVDAENGREWTHEQPMSHHFNFSRGAVMARH